MKSKFLLPTIIILANTLHLLSQNTCASPNTIANLPYTRTNRTNCTAVNDYSSGGCINSAFSSGADVVYRFTPTADMCIAISLYNVLPGTNVANNVSLYLMDGCPDTPGAICIEKAEAGFSQAQTANLTLNIAKIIAGKPYYIIIDAANTNNNSATACFNFDIEVKSSGCPKPPPPPLPTAPQGIECGNNLGFEGGTLANWNGCHYDAPIPACPVGQKFPNSCPPACTSYSSTSSGGVTTCTCNGCSNSNPNPPCCPFVCDVSGLKPGVNSLNGSLGQCESNTNSVVAAGIGSRHTITTGTGTDPNTDNKVTLVAPGGRNYSARIGNQEPGYESECLSQTFTVTTANALFTYLYAVVLQNPAGHSTTNQPRFEASIIDQSGSSPTCGGVYSVTADNAALDGFIKAVNPQCGVGDVWYKPWTAVATDLSAYIGQSVTIKFCTADCGQGGHYGYAYVDTYCKPLEIEGAIVCSTGSDVTLTAPQGFSGYTWYSGGLPLSGTPIATTYTLTVSGNTGGIYTVKLENIASPGCFSYITDTVKSFSAAGPNDTTFCTNALGPIVLKTTNTDPAHTTYSWTPATNLSCTTCQSPTVNPPYQNMTYSVTITNSAGCTVTKSVSVTAIACGPSVTATGGAVCVNGCVTVSATSTGGTPPYTYAWSSGGATGSTFNVCPTSVTIYTVTMTDASGFSSTDTAKVYLYPVTTLVTTKTDVKCIGGTDGTATVSASVGIAPYSFTWSTSPVQNTATAVNLAVGTYTVTSTDAKGCTQTATVTVGEPNPIVPVTSSVPALCGSTNGSASITATGGTGPYTYSWMPGNGNASTLPNLTNGVYTVTVTDINGCTASSTAIVNSVGGATITVQQTNISCNGGNNGQIVASISGGTTPYVISWSPTGGNGTTANSLIAGSYTVMVTDANNCQQSTIVILTEPPPLTAITSSISPNCPGSGSVSVTAGGGTMGYTYSWMPGSGVSQTVTGLSGGTYTVTVTDANNCSITSTTVITVPTPLVLTSIPVDGTCGMSNGSVSVNALGGTPDYTYTWAPTGAGQTSTGLAANTYSITITDSKGCTISTTVIILNTPPIAVAASSTNVSCFGGNDGTATATPGGGTAPINYIWTPSGGNGITTSTLKAGSYTVSVTDSKGCTATSSTTVTEPPPISIIAPPVGQICIGQSATLAASASGGTPAYTYVWSPNLQTGSSIIVAPTSNTSYTVVVTDSKGCTTSSTVPIVVGPPLQVTAGADKSVCVGASTTVTASASGGNGNYTYIWQPGNTNSSTFSITPNGTTTYTVMVSDGCGTPPVTATVTIQSVSPLVTPAFTPDSTFGCAPLCVQFNNISTGGVIRSCSWDFGDGGTSQACNPLYCYKKGGTYNVKISVTDTNNCGSTLTKTSSIKVFPIPTAGFNANPKSTSILSPTINFTDKSSPDAVKWDWNFGDVPNSGSTKKNPTYTYKDTGKYNVQLIVTTQYGCRDTIMDFIIIHGDYMFYVPNAFSPNGDGKNETFFPKGFMILEECYHLMIFDRWGNLIWETNDLNLGWDGKANGGAEVAQQDVYVWKIVTCDYTKKKYHYIGHVTLVK